MKTKRCTNPSCRKVFRVETRACPYCGKKYPRANPNAGRYMVILTHVGASRLAIAMALQRACGFNIGRGGILASHVPSLIDSDLTQNQANKLKVAIRSADGNAKIIPVSHGMKGIFVHRANRKPSGSF